MDLTTKKKSSHRTNLLVILGSREKCRESFFYVIGNSSNFLLHKKRSAGSHCGGVEKCRKGDPPQAENLACEILCSRRFLGNISSNTIFVQIAQKKFKSFVNFVNTFGIHHGIIILVKTPQYIIYSFCYTP